MCVYVSVQFIYISEVSEVLHPNTSRKWKEILTCGVLFAAGSYEDMAPWNIVFRGPNLEYIDYDTRGKTFDKSVKLVYQARLLL